MDPLHSEAIPGRASITPSITHQLTALITCPHTRLQKAAIPTAD